MALKPTPTGEARFDPRPEDQSGATLILGGQRLECRLVKVSLDSFGVSVPRSTAWTGNPIAKLLTHDVAYPVRIINQEPQSTGYHITLQRLELDKSSGDEQLGLTQRWIVHASRCCAVGLIAAMICCFVLNPGGSSQNAQRVRPQDVINYWTWPWQSSRHRDSLASETDPTALTTSHGESTDGMFEMPAISVSMTSSDRSMSESRQPSPSQRTVPSQSNLPWHVDPQAQVIAIATRRAQIKSSLQTARRGRSWAANSTSLPWLFSTTEPAFTAGPEYRMSEAARNDLILFESGLKSLAATTADDATRGLQRALLATTSASASTADFESLPDVRLIHSDDAEIYFQFANGAVEILRVVPRDGHDPVAPVRSTSPTSSRAPHSVNR